MSFGYETGSDTPTSTLTRMHPSANTFYEIPTNSPNTTALFGKITFAGYGFTLDPVYLNSKSHRQNFLLFLALLELFHSLLSLFLHSSSPAHPIASKFGQAAIIGYAISLGVINMNNV